MRTAKKKKIPHTRPRFLTDEALDDTDRTTILRSISWTPAAYNLMEAHRSKLGMDRSTYVRACVEHLLELRKHPELFQPEYRLTPSETKAILKKTPV